MQEKAQRDGTSIHEEAVRPSILISCTRGLKPCENLSFVPIVHICSLQDRLYGGTVADIESEIREKKHKSRRKDGRHGE